MEFDGHIFSDEVRSGTVFMPCLTTPAETDAGRSAPSDKGQQSNAAWQLWSESNRQFAPWHSEPHAMMQLDNTLVVPPPEVKELMHHMPYGWTAATGKDERTRHRMLGNGWHAGVAKVIIAATLLLDSHAD